MSQPKNVAALRKVIDQLDSDILALLSKRGEQVLRIGELKHKQNAPIRVPEREMALLNRLKRLNRGPYSDHALESIYREIISASLSIEAPLEVAYLGPETTFSHQAALAIFGHSVSLRPQPEFSQVFEDVLKGRAHYGVVPIENSIEGMVYRNLDLLIDHPLSICAEIHLPIRHCFLTHAKDLRKIKTIYSHAQAWGQCRRFLLDHGFDDRIFEDVSSTGKAAELAKRDRHSAAIASRAAGEMYGLPILFDSIEDEAHNETRFIVIGTDSPRKTGSDKTTIIFQTEDRPGVLAAILQDLATARVNLTKIESRPTRIEGWAYRFYLDMDGHSEDTAVARALKKVEKRCTMFRHVGSYPRYTSRDTRQKTRSIRKSGVKS